jgi:hypothetical protein
MTKTQELAVERLSRPQAIALLRERLHFDPATGVARELAVIDRFLPDPDVRERHQTTVRAPWIARATWIPPPPGSYWRDRNAACGQARPARPPCSDRRRG